MARIGFDHYTIAHRGFAPEATLRFARAHRFDGVQFLDPTAIVPSLDPKALADFRSMADEMGLYLEVGLPSPNPFRRTGEAGGAVADGQRAGVLANHVAALAALGCRHARLYIGDRHDRFRLDHPWDAQLAASLAVIRELMPCLRRTASAWPSRRTPT